MINLDTLTADIIKIKGEDSLRVQDELAIEEPLEIQVLFGDHPQTNKSISVTMRTPGNDAELALGFLFTEGLISGKHEVHSVGHVNFLDHNIIQVSLQPQVTFNMQSLDRNFYTTSSCGVCGKSSIDAIKTVKKVLNDYEENLQVHPEIIYSLPNILHQQQLTFKNTGGLHACGLFNLSGQLVLLREDVGRHNALDKLIGAVLNESLTSISDHLLLLSGRASFELIQKAWMAGIKIVAAIGAPSSLALSLAKECDITLLGFVKNGSFNIYSGNHRITIPTYEAAHQG